MYEYTSAGESGFGNLHLKYAYKAFDRLLIQMFKQGFNQIHEAVTIKDKSKLYKSRVVYIQYIGTQSIYSIYIGTQISTNLIVMENRIIDQYKSKKHCSPATIPCSKDVQSAKLKSIKTNLQSHHPECYQPSTNSLWQSKAALSPSNST
ncbi:Hypothetical_protein [Hexamita inflata]|uniref:Hypothetical_protein n=1 Tax=Hexamita inflata TaxID=28002 RepID=A0AA86R534_9EUKA|nr:Hypothetical protein HINF_LOCUS59301 [Hexamita inflata]